MTIEPISQAENPKPEPPLEHPTRRSTRKRYPSFKLRTALSARVQDLMEPSSYKDAMKSQYSVQWKAATKEELDALDRNRTWDLVDKDSLLRSGKRLIGCKWVYKLKRNASGSKRFKARLVIKGYEQEYGIDYQETFAPVAKFVSIRILFALAAQFDWEIDQLDVITAFLNPSLDEEVYMELPEGINIASASGGIQLVCKLRKALYGLKQAPRAWYIDIDTYLVNDLSLTRSQEDPNLYFSLQANIILLLWVDDILLFSPDRTAIQTMKNHLTSKYRMQDLGPVHQFLGIQVVRDRPNKTLHLHQKPYIESILKQFGMEHCNGVSTPLEPNIQLFANECTASPTNQLAYQHAIGRIAYLMLATRPDLAFSISALSSYCSNPSPWHSIAVLRMLRYLKKTLNIGITYSSNLNAIVQAAIKEGNSLGSGLTGLFGYTDSDWAGDKDSRKSTSGYIFTLYGGAISWKSTKQSIVATSSTEAEYIACSEGVKEALWLRRLMLEIQGNPSTKPFYYSHEIEAQNQLRILYETSIPRPLQQTKDSQTIFVDNQGAIKLSQNPRQHNRTKHIDVRYHFIRESCRQGLIKLVHVPTEEMLADILTKSLPRVKHEKHMKDMGLSEWGQ
jgi:hypothetical protein